MSYDKNMKYPPVLRVKFCELHVVVYKYKCIFKHKIRFFRKLWIFFFNSCFVIYHEMWSWCVVKPNSVIMCPDFHALSHGFIEEQKHNRKKKKQMKFSYFC